MFLNAMIGDTGPKVSCIATVISGRTRSITVGEYNANTGATINAAYSLDRAETVGSLEVGKQMDAVVVHGPAIDLVRVGADVIRFVIKKGRCVSGEHDARR